MDRILHGLIGQICFVYLDDVVIYSSSPEEHASHLGLVMDRMREHGLKLNGKKCYFAQLEVKLLGYVVSAAGIRSNPEKTRAIANMDPPRCVKDVRAFLGMAGYYRQTIPNFAEIAAPFLTRKHARWQWTHEQEKAFRDLQQLLQSDHVLTYPQTDKPYKLYCDASQCSWWHPSTVRFPGS